MSEKHRICFTWPKASSVPQAICALAEYPGSYRTISGILKEIALLREVKKLTVMAARRPVRTVCESYTRGNFCRLPEYLYRKHLINNLIIVSGHQEVSYLVKHALFIIAIQKTFVNNYAIG